MVTYILILNLGQIDSVLIIGFILILSLLLVRSLKALYLKKNKFIRGEPVMRKFGMRDKLGYLFGDFGNDFFFILVAVHS